MGSVSTTVSGRECQAWQRLHLMCRVTLSLMTSFLTGVVQQQIITAAIPTDMGEDPDATRQIRTQCTRSATFHFVPVCV